MASSSISALNERLRSVAGKGNCEEIEQLIRLGASFGADKYGRTALHYAAHYGQVKAVKLCIAKGCQLDTADTYGCTALLKAVAPDGHVEAVRTLLEEGSDVERQDHSGNTAVHEAAWNGFSQTLDVLIKIGKANILLQNKTGQKPIHLSCQKGHNQCTRLLLKAGSHPNVKNNSGETPLHVACLYGHIGCARILISAECDANAKNQEGNTPLHIAAGLGKQKITKLLLESQCEIKIRNKKDQTALDLARKNDHPDTIMLILGAHRMKKGKLSFFSRNKKKDGPKLDGRGNASHLSHGDGSPNDHRHKHRHGHDRGRGSDDPDGGQGGLRVRGRREIEANDRHSSGSSKGKSKKKRDKKPEDGGVWVEEGRSQNLFVRQELRQEQRLQHEIQVGRQLGNPHTREMGHSHVRTQLFKDKTGRLLEVPMPVQCNCTPYIKKLENQVEASKERLLHEIDMSKARFESRMNNVEKRMTHQAQSLDQLCKERISAERTDCIHRIDRRAKEERERWAEEHDARTDVLRSELREWFESRIQPLHEQLSRTCLDDSAIAASPSASRGRPRAGFYKLSGRRGAPMRKRSKSVGNVSDMEEEEDDEDESEDESDEEEEEEVDGGAHRLEEELHVASRQPSEQSPHRYKKNERAKEKEYAKSGAIPKKNRSGSFRQAVSDEDGASGSSSHSGTPLSMVAGTYRPPLIAAHERSPTSDHSLPPDFVLPSHETDDTDTTETSESETASQLSLETVSYKPKSISGSTDISSSTRDSGLHTLKGSSVSSDRRSHAPTRANLIAYQALTVNARPLPPLQAQTHRSPLVSAQPPPSQLRMQQTSYTPPFSPPVSPISTASQPLSSSTSTDGHRVDTPNTEHTASDTPSPTDSGKTRSTSSGISSGEASSLPNSSPIKYNIISPHSGQSYQRTYNPRSSATHEADLIKDVNSRNRTVPSNDAPPPYSRPLQCRVISAPLYQRSGTSQQHDRNTNSGNNNMPQDPKRPVIDPARNGISNTGSMTTSAASQFRISSTGSSEGNSSVSSRSAASRLGVTPSLNPVRGASTVGPRGYPNTVPSSDEGVYQDHPQSVQRQAAQPAYSVIQARKGRNGAVFAITGINQSHASFSNKNNNAHTHTNQGHYAPPASSSLTTAPLRMSSPHNTNSYSNGQNLLGNHHSMPPGANYTAPNGSSGTAFKYSTRMSGASDIPNGTHGVSMTNSYRRSSGSSSDGKSWVRTNGARHPNNDTHATAPTNSKQRGALSSASNGTSSGASSDTIRTSGAGVVTNGASSLQSHVETFNKNAAPEQKLKYTREIIL